MANNHKTPTSHKTATIQQTDRRQYLIDKKNKGEIHNRPALSKIGPRIKGIKLSADDKIKQAIRSLRTSDQDEYDTFEEADDFDVPDEYADPTSPYEMTEMEQDFEMEPHKVKEPEEEIKEESAPKEAPDKSADEDPPPPE